MDVITQSCVKEFLETNEIQSSDDSTNFELFANYSIVSKEYSSQFDPDDISVDENTPGIDGLAIIVNGKLVDDIDQVKDLIELNKSLEATFIFIQAKTSSKFEGSEMGNFGFMVKQFFSPKQSVFKGERIAKMLQIKDYIYDKSPLMTRTNPICKLHYVTTGIWKDDGNLLAILNQNVDELKSSNLFSDVLFEPCGATLIQRYYRKTKERATATFVFDKKVTLPSIVSVKESYVGFLPFSEYRKIIIDEYGKMRSIFDDNIRDFLGDVDVNKKIEGTLRSQHFDLFGVLNNGVTLVATTLNATGDKFTISDYQVVNGCQTSHVLFENKDVSGIDNTIIPIRLIVTDSDDVKNEITKATNNQNAIKPEQLESLSEFQKQLEQYYKSITCRVALFYERRTNQYNTDISVGKSRIITIPTQIKTFSSMFLDSPHLVSGYYGTLAKRFSDRIFREDHRLLPYFISGYSFYKLENAFKVGLVDKAFKIARFHLLMIVLTTR
ncbi:MAG: AIPR family protein [Chitinivibrionales bacterium]|nr:AIPR family protein [Chitinivibrionales bacterium]